MILKNRLENAAKKAVQQQTEKEATAGKTGKETLTRSWYVFKLHNLEKRFQLVRCFIKLMLSLAKTCAAGRWVSLCTFLI